MKEFMTVGFFSQSPTFTWERIPVFWVDTLSADFLSPADVFQTRSKMLR